ncbi:F-box domain-containing protein [Mycena sanguinolenta]|uniref:F-box domain-containing protein n=1 Tax=Mycena sanguinolenta TaxID=230812 RepID=A0A8H7DCZ2_9AGAR|nr:F-box domain-containing protein [Mycena sanguinolenta]
MLSELAADRTRVADLDVEILALERSLSASRIQRAQVQERLDAYKYPVLTLPNEIIAEIFIHYLPNYPHCPPLAGLESPTLLTQICRKWRGIALSTPALWRAISLPDPDIPPAEQGALLEAWLGRCRVHPISLRFHVYSEPGELGTEILTAIGPHRTRLQYLVLNQISLPQLLTFEGPISVLRHLELLLEDQEHPLVIKLSFCDSPLLRTALLNANGVESTMMPWAQLTSLALHEFFPADCAPILQHTLNLVHCELALVEDPNHEHVPDVTLPSLRSLTLTHILKADSITGYLQTLTLPGLRSLRVPETFLGPNPIDTLKSFVSKSGCKLERLCVTGTRSGFDSFYPMAFPSTKISFAQWAMSSVDWIITEFGDARELEELSATASE